MKKILALLALVTVVTSLTGCGCIRRMRDFVCRGATCGNNAVMAAAAPIAYAQPCPACPPQGMAFDASCAYGPGVQTYGYGSSPGYDSGWQPGCDSCSGGSYDMPQYDSPSYPIESGGSSTSPGPAPLN